MSVVSKANSTVHTPTRTTHRAPQARSLRTREKIISAAWDLVRDHGADAREFTIRGIATKAKVSTGAIYHQFDDLDAILSGVAERYCTLMLETVDQTESHQEFASWAAWQRADLAAHEEFFRQWPNLRRLWFDDHASPGVIEVHRGYLNVVAERSNAWITRLTGTELSLMTHMVAASIAGALYKLLYAVEASEAETVKAELYDAVLGYYERHLGRAD